MVKKLIFAALLQTVLFFSYSVFAQQNNSANQSEVRAVSSVDLKRYAGKWFEIARYPNKFQKNCVGNATATYSQKTDDQIEVLSQCVKKNGTPEILKTDAKISDKTTNAKFDVKNAPGDFWIVDLDPNYGYAAVGDPKRQNLWILSRDPEMKDAVYQNILRRVEKMGFNPGKLVKTPQKIEIIKGAVVLKN